MAGIVVSARICGRKGVLVASSADESDDAGGQLTHALHGEHGSHHGTSPFGRSELGSDDGRERVVAPHTLEKSDAALARSKRFTYNTHDNAPEDDDADDGDTGRSGRESLS